ncbi:MAG: hypothetical protein Q4C64_04835 [Erysipelotrichia bacterium]|nr:hypothetical protein [Erysipelotrichia bacterium]
MHINFYNFQIVFFVIFIFIFIAIVMFMIIGFIKTSRQANKIFDFTRNQMDKFANEDRQRTNNSDHNPSHFEQQDYQIRYSRKNKDSFDKELRDKPLSEAEKNVLNGK